jgi:hypothetical protein
MPTDDEINKQAVALTKALTDQGKLIEANWIGYRALVVPRGAGPVQVEECRRAFFAGAQALFASIMTVLDPGAEPTETDLKRMDAISDELRAFAASVGN